MFLMPIIVIWCGGKKNGSFGFAKGRLVRWAKPNVPFAGWHRISKYFVRWEKK